MFICSVERANPTTGSNLIVLVLDHTTTFRKEALVKNEKLAEFVSRSPVCALRNQLKSAKIVYNGILALVLKKESHEYSTT